MVLVPVTVTDRGGKTLDGLQAENFEILDDHMRQEIVSFASDDAPCSVGLVLDISGSMRDTLGIAKNVTHTFFEAANPGDEFFLLTVSTQPDTVSGFSADTVSLEKTIESTRPAGMTALIDTVYLGLSRMRGAKRPRRALLILSDGMDNHSRYSKSELLRVALEADVQVYTIIVGTAGGDASGSGGLFRPSMAAKPWDQAHERQGPDLLEELSEKTGGLHFRVHDAAEAANAAGKAGRALRNEYVIGYQSPAPRDQGKWHRIRVKADVPHASVYARSGYFAP
jgi:Ca-activated chloride channel family protein